VDATSPRRNHKFPGGGGSRWRKLWNTLGGCYAADATDEQTNKLTNRWESPLRKAPFRRRLMRITSNQLKKNISLSCREWVISEKLKAWNKTRIFTNFKNFVFI